MILTRRGLVTLALMLWLGGFLFYSSIVVPIGRSVLNPASDQAFVTREVSALVNYLGGAAAVILLWDVLATNALIRGRLVFWLFLAASVGALTWLRGPLASSMDPETMTLTYGESAKGYHWAYMIVGGLQMLLGLVFTGLTLAAWRKEDQQGERRV